jgi:RimJ/RimL family protein N-acetyltransferase
VIDVPRDQDWTLQTNRLLLSPMLAADAEQLFDLLKEPSLYTFTRAGPPSSLQSLRQRIRFWEQRRSPDGQEVWLNWTVRLRADQTVVGYVQASIKATHAELAWIVGLPFQGHGYASEAMVAVVSWLNHFLKIGEVRANIHPSHSASQRVATRIGLQLNGQLTPEGEQVWAALF